MYVFASEVPSGQKEVELGDGDKRRGIKIWSKGTWS